MKKPKSELKLGAKWYDGNLQLARWSDCSTKVLKTAFFRLRDNIIRKLSPYCMHLKGRGGVKGAVRCIYNKVDTYPYAARFDVDSYYGSIDHKILFKQLESLNISPDLMHIVKEYVKIPDTERKGKGIVAGGALSNLLGAVYLSSLDSAMNRLYKKGNIFYIRYQDDIVILAKTRWKLRHTIKELYQIIDKLKLTIHQDKKRFIGKTEKGFSFLGYFFKSGRKLRPAKESLNRVVERTNRLIKQGTDVCRIREYVTRWYCYFHAGLLGIATYKGGIKRIQKFIEIKLGLNLTE